MDLKVGIAFKHSIMSNEKQKFYMLCALTSFFTRCVSSSANHVAATGRVAHGDVVKIGCGSQQREKRKDDFGDFERDAVVGASFRNSWSAGIFRHVRLYRERSAKE